MDIFASRITDLLEFLAAEYGIQDQDACLVLLGSLLKAPGLRQSWLTIETDWLMRDCDRAWFSLGGHATPRSLASLRAPQLWRAAALEFDQWIAETKATSAPMILIEPEWRRIIPWPQGIRGIVTIYLGQALRLRTPHPPRLSIDVVEPQQHEWRRATLEHHVRGIIASAVRESKLPRVTLPPDFGFWCELCQKLMRPWPAVAWQELANLIAAIAARNAMLWGRPETNAEDWGLASRILAQQIPAWTADVLGFMRDNPTITTKHLKLVDPAARVGKIALNAFPSTARSPRPAVLLERELRRLAGTGAIYQFFNPNTRSTVWRPADEINENGLLWKLLEGKALVT